MSLVRELLIDLDHRWASRNDAKLRLRIIGSTALMLQTDYARGTKDSDVLETIDLDASTRDKIVQLAGPGTDLHRRHRMYVEFVPLGLPLLPQQPKWLAIPDLNVALKSFHVEVLAISDVIVSKLTRFHSNDQSDIAAMVERNLVPHAELVERFKLALDYFSLDARAETTPKIIANFHRVERDLFGEAETVIDLPAWLDP